MRVFARRTDAYAANSWIFLIWMVATSLVLLTVAILFLRNQIRPIVRLADAAEAFGKGREAPNFRPRGAREVRRAAAAFLEMKSRIERAIEQRTTMLAGVSHDLRTVLTRFKLELALLGDSSRDRGDQEGRRRDGGDARGLSRLRARRHRRAVGADRHRAPPRRAASSIAERHGHRASVAFHGQPIVTVRPAAFKRCLANLVSNAARFASDRRHHRRTAITAGSP